LAGKKAKRRLTNIRPREVSIVDEAANEEDFIFFKGKEGGQMNRKEAELFDDVVEDINKSTESSDVVDAPADDDVIKQVSHDVKESVLKAVRETTETLMSIAKSIDALEVVSVDNDSEEENVDKQRLPGDVITQIKDVAKSLVKVIAQFGEPISKEAPVEKAGRKLSKERLKKLEDVISILSELVQGASPQDTSSEKGGSNVSDKTTNKSADAEVTDPKTEQTPEEVKPVEGEEVVKTEETPSKETTATEAKTEEKKDEDSEVVKLLKGLDEKIDAVVGRVENLEKSASAPTSKSDGDVEDTVETEVKKEKPKSLFHSVIHGY